MGNDSEGLITMSHKFCKRAFAVVAINDWKYFLIDESAALFLNVILNYFFSGGFFIFYVIDI